MNKVLLLLITISLSYNLYSQKIDNDTLTAKKMVKSPWALKIEFGAVYHQMFNPEFIDNKILETMDLTLFYRNVFFTYGAFIHEFRPNRNMIFDNININSQNEFSSINLNVAIGYLYNFNENWSTDFKFGFNSTDFEITNSKVTNVIYQSDIIFGAQFGVGIDRYLKLKRFNYIVLGFGIDYYSTDYSKISGNMKPSSLNYSLTIAYKGFFKKMVE